MKLFKQVSLPANQPFLNNKYTLTYYAIVATKHGAHRDPLHYEERHHIVPDSFFIKNRTKGKSPGWLEGNSNEPGNLIYCTAREHFILHWLLTKMVPKNSLAWFKMMKAFAGFIRSSKFQERIWTSGQFNQLRIALYLSQKGRPSSLKGKPSGRKGEKKGPHSEERKRNIGISNSGPNPNKKPKTQEEYNKRAENCRMMTARRLAEGKSRKDFTVSDETRHKQSLAKKGKKCGPEHHMYGKKHRSDTIALMKANRKPKVVKDEDCVYELISPTGVLYTTSNLFNFGKLHGLKSTTLRKISKPDHQHRRHRGWAVRRRQ